MTANSDRRELKMRRLPRAPTPALGASEWSGVVGMPVFWSMRTAWRWEKVPRWASWPVMRTSRPSCSRRPKAIASAVAQSIVGTTASNPAAAGAPVAL